MIRACCQEMVPACRAARVKGRAVVSRWEVDSSDAAFGSLTVRTQASSAMAAISWAVFSCGDSAGGVSAVVPSRNSVVVKTFKAAVLASSREMTARRSREPSTPWRSGSGPAGSSR